MTHRHPFRFLLVLSALAAAGLACSTLGGSSEPNDGAPPTELGPQVEDAQPTESSEDAETSDEAPTEASSGDYTGDDYTGDDATLCATAPEDVPVMPVGTTFTYCDATTLSFQTGEASFDEVLEYYQDELKAAGWAEDSQSGVAVVTTDAAVLYYEKDGRSIVVTVSYSSSDQLTTLQIIVSP